MTAALRANWQGILSAVALLVSLGAIVYGAGGLGQRVQACEARQARLDDVPERLARVEERIDGLSQRVDDVATSVDRIEEAVVPGRRMR